MFVLNGYEDLESFEGMDEAELDYLGITSQAHRAKLMAAVELLHDSAGIQHYYSLCIPTPWIATLAWMATLSNLEFFDLLQRFIRARTPIRKLVARSPRG